MYKMVSSLCTKWWWITFKIFRYVHFGVFTMYKMMVRKYEFILEIIVVMNMAWYTLQVHNERTYETSKKGIKKQ